MQGNAGALSEQQKRGLRAFMDTGCLTCHFSPYLGGKLYQKFGVFEPYQKYTKSVQVDEGRFAVTKNESDRLLFKVPVLRNVAMTPPYFHDGSVDRLVDAITIMAKVQLARDLTTGQADDIAAFLHALTGKLPESLARVPALPAAE
jgi:cytochrome c peroxidase